MIQSLSIRNIVLIEELSIQFHPGMQAMTGETGAGKSIVVDAVNLILGGRADRGLIRSGCDRASVEAVFDVPGNASIREILEREGIEFDGSTVTVYREMNQAGKNLCRVCGVLVSVALLRELGGYLMDIHGQHDHRFLMDPDMHMSFLDGMGDAAYRELLERTKTAFDAFMEAHQRYARLRRENERKQLRVEELEKALRELHEAKLKPGEDEALREESLRLRNSQKIMSALREARDALSAGGQESSVLDRTKAASALLGSLKDYGERMKSLGERCESAYYELEEIVFELHGLMEESDADPERLEKTEARLDLIRRLERKYGENTAAVLEEQRRMEQEYENLCGLEDALEDTAKEHKRLLAAYRQEARVLSEARKALAVEFEKGMAAGLAGLGMEKARFQVSFLPQETEKKPMPRPVGDDRTEFMFSANPGEPLKPLAGIASGGELSRLMLAMKAMEAEGTGVDCMVFDEIDTGISGRMAQAVAEKMIAISRGRQVICVTHLPQIAAAADYQFFLSKEARDGRTYTSMRELGPDERVREVARMISGAEGSGTDAEVYARSMLEASENRKETLKK